MADLKFKPERGSKQKLTTDKPHPRSHDPQEGSLLIMSDDDVHALNLIPHVRATDEGAELVVHVRTFVAKGVWDGQPYSGYTTRAKTMVFKPSQIAEIVAALGTIEEGFAEWQARQSEAESIDFEEE